MCGTQRWLNPLYCSTALHDALLSTFCSTVPEQLLPARFGQSLSDNDNRFRGTVGNNGQPKLAIKAFPNPENTKSCHACCRTGLKQTVDPASSFKVLQKTI
jgi:hypothetical protein